MKLLDRYLMLQFTRNLLLTICSLLAIYLLVDFFERVDNFLEAQKTIGLAARYLLLKTPFIYEQIIPVCILLAGVITLGVLNHHHEFMALKAGGICVARIIRPLFVAAGLFTLLTMALDQWVLPVTVSATNKIWYEEVNKQVPKGIDRYGRTYYRGKDGIFSFVRPAPAKNLFTSFSYAAWDENHDPYMLLDAAQASWDNGQWVFKNGQAKIRSGSRKYQVTVFKELNLSLKERPEDFFMPAYKVDEQSLTQMFRSAWNKDGSPDPSAWAVFHKKLSYVFLGFPLLLLGIPVLLAMHRTRGRDLALAIPISCGLAFAAWGLWSASQAMANSAYLQPGLASWSVHLVAGGLGIFFIRRHNH